MKKHRIDKNIKLLKSKTGLSWMKLTAEMASKGLYIEPKTLEAYGNGKNEPNIDVINELANFFNLTIEEFCYGNIDGSISI